MNPVWGKDDVRCVAAAYSIGVAEPADAITFEMLIEQKDSDAVTELRAFEETATRLAYAAPVQRPAASLRERLLNGIKRPKVKPLPGFKEEIPGFHVLRSGTGKWKQSPVAGVESMLLSHDPAAGVVTTLLRMSPGTTLPKHHHSKEEQCWVLQGDIRNVDGDISMNAGDFVRAMPGTDHSAITTTSGCLLLIVASAKDETSTDTIAE